jgi:hypothetical protein
MMHQANTPKNGTSGHEWDIQTAGLSFIEVDHSVINPSHHAHAPSPYLVSEDNLLSKLCDRKHRELTLDNQ